MNYVQIILAAAKAAKTSGLILLAICTHESKLTNVTVPNDKGTPTYGICQVKYATAQMLGYQGEAEGLLNPKENAKWAANYLRYQQVRYGDWCRAVAAYNAGRYNESKVMPGYPRNIKYVNKVKNISTQHFTCDKIYTESSGYAKNNGPRLRIQSTK